eukprot:1154170-Pelagomonas_calceolata.AAC.3
MVKRLDTTNFFAPLEPSALLPCLQRPLQPSSAAPLIPAPQLAAARVCLQGALIRAGHGRPLHQALRHSGMLEAQVPPAQLSQQPASSSCAGEFSIPDSSLESGECLAASATALDLAASAASCSWSRIRKSFPFLASTSACMMSYAPALCNLDQHNMHNLGDSVAFGLPCTQGWGQASGFMIPTLLALNGTFMQPLPENVPDGHKP